jgi:hypothetical protein
MREMNYPRVSGNSWIGAMGLAHTMLTKMYILRIFHDIKSARAYPWLPQSLS